MDMHWLLLGGGIFFDWCWVVVRGGGYILAGGRWWWVVVDGSGYILSGVGWRWVLVDGGGWWDSLV